MSHLTQIMEKKSIVFIMNPISGTASKAGVPDLIKENLDQEKFEYEIRMTEYAGHASEIAKEAMNNGIDIVVAVGGDGTVNEVARAIVHSNTALGIIPCGSGNGLARHLLLPMNAKKAIEIINACDIHDFDYGIINEHPFFCTCGMGFDAFVSKKFADSGKRGPISYAEQILKEGLSYKPQTYTIKDENGATTYNAWLISCANASQYGNNAYIAPQASMSDGWLDIIIMEPFDMIEAPEVWLEMFNKTLDKNPNIKTFRSKNIHVHRDEPGVIHYDGDPVMAGTDIDVEIVEKGIKVLINPFTDRSQRQPSKFQNAATELLNEINNIRTGVREDFTQTSKQIQAITKAVQKKLNL